MKIDKYFIVDVIIKKIVPIFLVISSIIFYSVIMILGTNLDNKHKKLITEKDELNNILSNIDDYNEKFVIEQFMNKDNFDSLSVLILMSNYWTYELKINDVNILEASNLEKDYTNNTLKIKIKNDTRLDLIERMRSTKIPLEIAYLGSLLSGDKGDKLESHLSCEQLDNNFENVIKTTDNYTKIKNVLTYNIEFKENISYTFRISAMLAEDRLNLKDEGHSEFFENIIIYS